MVKYLGSAEVECSENTIEIVFITEDVFQGRIYAIGHANDSRCVSRDIGKRTTSIIINKNECGVEIRRTTNPSMIIASVKIMLSFHRDFVTKVDRGYEISCIYTHGGDTVEYPIQVATPSLASFTAIADLPHCIYEVLDPQTGLPAELVSTCAFLEMWCMRVHTCRVDDGSGTEFIVLDERGCSVDQFLLDNLDYAPNGLFAQKESHAFKFSDRLVVNFECSIRIDLKENGQCSTESHEVKVRSSSLKVQDPQTKPFNLSDLKTPAPEYCISRTVAISSTICLALFSSLIGATAVILVFYLRDH
ncbi:hypothetical protein WR25_00200 [Diploscapter pachys]|uniref:ZP domain-containing protein n=1 Tax=Diploscapter pachys TaxID=2018661 RepID=A0A2A2J3U9_9BILA|nr:hypothetical protein WR25_00200 [Diploscapter pachys]